MIVNSTGICDRLCQTLVAEYTIKRTGSEHCNRLATNLCNVLDITTGIWQSLTAMFEQFLRKLVYLFETYEKLTKH